MVIRPLDQSQFQVPRWFPKFLPNHHRRKKVSSSTALSKLSVFRSHPSIVVVVTANMPSATASKKDQKNAAPAAKNAGTKPGAGAAKTAPVAIATTVEEVPRLTGGRPDQAAFNAQQDALKKEIDGVQAQLVRYAIWSHEHMC